MPLIVPAEPARDDVAAFRAYLDGIAPRLVVARYGARYLEHEPSAHRILSTIRRSLITALRLHHRHDEAQLLRTAQPGRLSPAAARRLDTLLRQLPDLALPIPALTDPVEYRLTPRSDRSRKTAFFCIRYPDPRRRLVAANRFAQSYRLYSKFIGVSPCHHHVLSHRFLFSNIPNS